MDARQRNTNALGCTIMRPEWTLKFEFRTPGIATAAGIKLSSSKWRASYFSAVVKRESWMKRLQRVIKCLFALPSCSYVTLDVEKTLSIVATIPVRQLER